MPRPFTENSQREYSTDQDEAREVTPKFHRPSANTVICTLVIIASITAAALLWTDAASARTGQTQPQPMPAPEALVKARAACPVDKPLKCRAALVRAYRGIQWQRTENLKLAREMVGKLTDWICIHGGEGAWNSHTGNGYYGGLQMDAQFERTYGRDMLQRYHGHAYRWPPRKQIIVAQRAFSQNRGYNPWPTTGRKCGLIL